ncbi:MAG: S8 family serine peptidase [Methanospirillum sp.]|nr:S8 family serine peptidase [Methanospirillum sp.]
MHRFFFALSGLILVAAISCQAVWICQGDASPSPEKDWKSKVSSDLLQIMNLASCPPGQTPDDMVNEMEEVGQVRRNAGGDWLAHVSLTLREGMNGIDILSYVTDADTDESYHLVTGWVSGENLSLIAEKEAVQAVRPVFPPAGSGSLIPVETPGDQISPGISTWKKKLSTDLLQLIDDSYLSPGQSRSDILDLMRKTGEIRSTGDETEIHITVKTSGSSSPSNFRSFFTEPATDQAYGKIGGWISSSNITGLAMQDGIISLMVQIPPRTSQIETEGDYLLGTKEYRNSTGFTGKGITVGVISDGVDGLSDLVSAGELPPVKVLSNRVGGDEGTAMLQIIHDIAPDATLMFHDRGSSQIEYVHALDQLIINGSQIICDDITYVEPFFEDGYVSQNIIDRILSYNILYITAAGNFAKEHYQAPFMGYEDQGYQWQVFNGSKGRDLHFKVEPGIAGHVILQWDDRFGRSANNYDLFLYDESGREIARSVNLQDGDDDPMEWVRFMNSGDKPREYTVRVVQAAAENALLEIYVLPLSGRSVVLDPCTVEDSVFGQQAVKNALTVGAAEPDPKQVKNQDYSSQGPVLIQYPEEELREKPDIVAPDHVTVLTGSMDSAVFTGSSAAAPHIAGLAALIWSADPSMKEEDVRRHIISATGSRETGQAWNRETGHGLPSAANLTPIQPGINNTTTHYPIDTICSFEPRNDEEAGEIILYSGWNMVSIPYPLASGSNTGRIFGKTDTACHTIWRYEPSDHTWHPVRTSDTLSQMDVVWIYAEKNQDLSLTFDNTGINQTVKQLHPGWNPVGVPGKESITAYDLLSPLTDAWTNILVYDSRTQEYRPSIINGGNGTYSTDRLLYPGEGWWIYMNRPGILFPVS